jgi:MoxR-like ATPase
MSYTYTRTFDPPDVHRPDTDRAQPAARGDLREASPYVFTDEIVLAVNVALATGRPLLVRGPSGTGKSTLARSAARVLQRRYYERVVTSRMQAQDLLWEVDLLRRLQDAQTGTLSGDDLAPYVRPGVLWWAFDRDTARRCGRDDVKEADLLSDPARGTGERAVVLLDEIDKADPDVPNNLLVPLGSLQFQVEATGAPVEAEAAPLVFITTNDERALPDAFLRRCVEVKLELPDRDRLVKIGTAHFPDHSKLVKSVADRIFSGNGTPQNGSPTSGVSPAEFLDTVRAARDLKLDVNNDDAWAGLSNVTLWKEGRSTPLS